jgi:hypothetical protein
MAEKPPQAKSVLGALPAKRPERIGAPRNGAVKPRAARPQPKRDPKPRAVSPGAEALTRAHPAPPPQPLAPPTGTELVTTAIRATGELAQIGLTLSGRALKRTLHRLPHP